MGLELELGLGLGLGATRGFYCCSKQLKLEKRGARGNRNVARSRSNTHMRVRLHLPAEGLGTFKIQAATAGRQKLLGQQERLQLHFVQIFSKEPLNRKSESELLFKEFFVWEAEYFGIALIVFNK